MRRFDADALKMAICQDQCEKDGCDYICSEIAYVDDAPTVELTDEAAIKHLQASGWMQNHDREMTRPGWISVKDRLPEKHGPYLCYLGHYPFGPSLEIVNYNEKKGSFWWFEGNVKAPYVTHWMPLPEQPEEDDLK